MSIGGDDDDEYGERVRVGGDDHPPYEHERGPEHEASSFGRRPPARTGRSMVTVVGVVVLLVAAIAFANRGNDGAADETRAPAPGAAPTAPSGQKPVTDRDEATSIPSGFPRTEQGAQSAAANYAVALGGDGMFTTRSRNAIVDAVFTDAPERRPELDKVYGDAKFLQRIGLKEDGSAPDGMIFVSRTNPVGTDLVKYGGSQASVAVWYSSLFGLAGAESENPVAESWYTTTFELTWADSTWKVERFDQEDGPTPIGQDQRASSAEEMADAVERFGGLTYAR